MNLKIVGSIAFVAGTAIGAGMLALPMATAALGVIPALLLMVVIWAVSAYTSLLMLEINLRSGVGDNLHAITGKTLGKKAQAIQGVSFLSLLFALTAAYLSGGSALLVMRFDSLFGIALDPQHAVLLFTFALGGISALGIAWVDKLSRLLFSLMLVLLVMVVAFLLPEVNSKTMAAGAVHIASGPAWLAAIPVVITSFGFHVGIATLVRYLEGDSKSLRKVFLIGSSIPLVCYVLWLVVTLGTVGGETIEGFGGTLPKLIGALQQAAAEPLVGKCVSVFADLALITSFLGAALSLFDFLAELTRAKKGKMGRLQTWLITFVPPVLCALFVPEGFIAVLGFAAIPLVVMIIFLPIAMARRQRALTAVGYQVRGGNLALALLGLVGVTIIAAQLYVAL